MILKEIRRGLGEPLQRKITDTIDEAKKQLLTYKQKKIIRRIVYLVVYPDILLALDSKNIDILTAYLKKQSDDQIEVKYQIFGY